MEQAAIVKGVFRPDDDIEADEQIDLTIELENFPSHPKHAISILNTTDVEVTVILYNKETFSDDEDEAATFADTIMELARFTVANGGRGMVLVEGLGLGTSTPEIAITSTTESADANLGIGYCVREA